MSSAVITVKDLAWAQILDGETVASTVYRMTLWGRNSEGLDLFESR
jgi:hypothetical protein